jgi:cytidyltransferase-like protein
MITGYTSGAFDLFHVGHVRLLRAARSLCDRLIVGVSTDSLVLKYKGRLPIIGFHERAEIVRANRDVTTVVALYERDRWEDWLRLKFDVLFVGNDWFGRPEWIAWEGKLKAVGIPVVYLSRTPDVSTSVILTAIRRGE